VYLGANTEEWFAAGREVWGHQKKLGVTTLSESEGTGIVTGRLERPAGSALMEISVGPFEREARPDEIGFLPVLSLRVIPHPEKGVAQTAELILTEAELTLRRGSDGRIEYWAGPGNVTFPIPSDRDPLYRLRVGRILGGYYGCFDGIVTPFGKILKKLV
jgi:acetoacetate decarboxylase